MEAILGRKQEKHRRCVEVAAITRYQSSRRQQRVPGVVTCSFTQGPERFETTLTKCLRHLNNLNFKVTFTIDINYKRLLRTISPSFLTMWQLASEARSH